MLFISVQDTAEKGGRTLNWRKFSKEHLPLSFYFSSFLVYSKATKSQKKISCFTFIQCLLSCVPFKSGILYIKYHNIAVIGMKMTEDKREIHIDYILLVRNLLRSRTLEEKQSIVKCLRKDKMERISLSSLHTIPLYGHQNHLNLKGLEMG